MRLQYDNASVSGTDDEKAAIAMKKYTYYKCFRSADKHACVCCVCLCVLCVRCVCCACTCACAEKGCVCVCVAFRCKKAYFGGEEACAVGSNEFDEEELVCPACSGGDAQQICPKHGTDFLEYKVCRLFVKRWTVRLEGFWCDTHSLTHTRALSFSQNCKCTNIH